VTSIHIAIGAALIAFNLAAGVWGAWGWWRHTDARGFWPLLRIGQGLVMLQAIDGAILVLTGYELPELHLIYGLVPIGVSFIAEQLRLAAADTVLAQRDLEGRADVEALPPGEQQALVRVILRREMGVMAASALVVTALALRAL
jgi:hypothetical protein